MSGDAENKEDKVIEIPDVKKEEKLTEIPIDEKAEDLKDEKTGDEAAQAMFWESFLDKIVAGIMSSFGWANSNLVNQAMKVTVITMGVAGSVEVAGSSVGILWAFFAIVFLITLAGGTWGLGCCTKCANCLCPLAPDIDASDGIDEPRERSGTTVELGARMASSTGQTVLITMFDILFIRTLPIVSAMSFNNAAQRSFELIASGHTGDKNEKYRNFAMWLYAIVMTVAVLQFLSCYSGCIPEEEMDAEDEMDENGNRRADLSDNMTKKYFFTLMVMVLKCSLALAYRLALATIFKSLFLNDDGKNDGGLTAVYWTYTAIITTFTVIVLTTGDRYACCVPTRQGLPFQSSTRSRNLLTETITGAMKLNVAFAWLDSIFASLAPLAGTDKIVSTLIVMLLAYAIFVVTDYLIQKFLLSMVEKLNSGVFDAVGAARRSVTNDNEKRAPEAVEEAETNNTSDYCGDLCTQSLLIISASLVVVSGNSVAPFVEAVVLDMQNVKTIKELTDATGIWIAVVISLVFCALVASCLGCCVAKAKAATAGVLNATTDGVKTVSGVGSKEPEVELETKDTVGTEVPVDVKE